MKQPERPIDDKDMPWSYLGKDALDAASERLWLALRNTDEPPYHLLSSGAQYAVQRAVLTLMGTDVPALLRRRANEIYADPKHEKPELWPLEDLADELEEHHG